MPHWGVNLGFRSFGCCFQRIRRGWLSGTYSPELKIPNSTLSHHLEKLKARNLVTVSREKQFLWYAANEKALMNLLGFLFAECCSRNRVIDSEEVFQICR